MRKRITIFTTKSLTINRFLDQIIIDLNNKYELNVVCKDPNKQGKRRDREGDRS